MLKSIKSKFVGMYIIGFMILLIGVGLFLSYRLEKIIIGSVDSHLKSEIQIIVAMWEMEGGHFEVELATANIGDYSHSLSGDYYQLIDKGEVVARSPSLSITHVFLPDIEETFEPFFETIIGPGAKTLRMLTHSFHTAIGDITIQASEPLIESNEMLHSFRINLIIIFSLALFISIPLIIKLTKSTLIKLVYLSDRISEVTEKNLNERLDIDDLDKELKPLAINFNELLYRLGIAFNKQKEFLSNASHDLRTPVSIIKTTTEVTLIKERPVAEYQDALNRILNSANGMGSVIEKILTVSRLDNSAYLFNYSDVNLKKLLQGIVTFFEPYVFSRGYVLTIKGDDIIIRSDAERIKEAIVNLVDNALKYNKPEGRVDIEIAKTDGKARITIRDTGIGISNKDKNKIFTRFYREDRTGSNIVKGCGLGLSISNIIIEKLGGTIEVKSEPGKGTTFTIYLPLKENQSTSQLPIETAPQLA